MKTGFLAQNKIAGAHADIGSSVTGGRHLQACCHSRWTPLLCRSWTQGDSVTLRLRCAGLEGERLESRDADLCCVVPFECIIMSAPPSASAATTAAAPASAATAPRPGPAPQPGVPPPHTTGPMAEAPRPNDSTQPVAGASAPNAPQSTSSAAPQPGTATLGTLPQLYAARRDTVGVGFAKSLLQFLTATGAESASSAIPCMAGNPLDLHVLFRTVLSCGGSVAVRGAQLLVVMCLVLWSECRDVAHAG